MAYTKSRRIVIDKTKVGGSTQTSFPMLFSGTYYWLKTIANGGSVTSTYGYDIGFFADKGLTKPLFWEVETYVGTTGAIVAWVQIPIMSSTVDTTIYLAYGDSTLTKLQSDPTRVWDTNYKAVWHLGDGAGIRLDDMSGNGNVLTNHGSTAAAGQIAGAVNVASASSQWIGAADSTSTSMGTGPLTVSGWVKGTTITDNSSGWFSKDNYPFSVTGITGNISGGSKFNFEVRGAGGDLQTLSAQTVAAGQWYYVVGVRDGTSPATIRQYINGVQDGSSVEGGSNNVNTIADATIGTLNSRGLTQYWNGVIDEVRMSSTNRTAAWILGEYNNQVSPSTFYTIGADN